MPARLVALDEGPDIPMDRPMIVVGRHPQCDARLDSIRISRRHCCMTHQDNGDLIVRDLGSTNGIRINGQRVETGRLRPGDELSIAHIRFRLDSGVSQDATQLGPVEESDEAVAVNGHANGHGHAHAAAAAFPLPASSASHQELRRDSHHDMRRDDNALAAAVREMLPAAVAEKCRIKVIVKMEPDAGSEDSSGS